MDSFYKYRNYKDKDFDEYDKFEFLEDEYDRLRFMCNNLCTSSNYLRDMDFLKLSEMLDNVRYSIEEIKMEIGKILD